MTKNETASVSPSLLYYAFKYAIKQNDYSAVVVANAIVSNVEKIPKLDLCSMYRDFLDIKFETAFQEEIWDKVAVVVEKQLGDYILDYSEL